MAEKAIQLQLWNQSYVRLRTVQGEDSSRTIAAEILEESGAAADLTGYTASVYILGKGGQKITQPAELDGNTVTAVVPYIGFSGEADVQICLAKSESEMLKVTGLTLDILPSDLEGAAEGSDEFNDLAALIGRTADAIAAANAAAQNANQTAADVEERADSGEFDGASGTIDTTTASPLTGLLKGNGTTVETAQAGIDYLPPAGGDVSGDLRPSVTDTYSLGDASSHWANVYGRIGQFSENIKVDGNNVWHAGNLAIADYVVEQGASGSWQYRKWNSGAAECWGNITIETLNMQSVWEGSHYTNPNPASAFPGGLFTEKPKHISVSPNFNGALITWADMYNSTAATLRFGALRMGTEGESFHDVGFSVYAAGRWK